MSDAEKLSKIFEALAPLERWVPYTLTPSKSRPGKTDKVPGTKARRLSTSNPDHWFTLEDAGTAGDVGLVFTGGITQDGYTLLGFDVDNATKDFRFPIDTYIETSPSGHGLRAFAWCKSEWLEPYQDCTNAEAEDCEHVETYFGTAPRFLTVTFDFLGLSEIAVLTEKQFKEIAPWLKEKEKSPANQTPPKATGTPLDLSAYKLTDEHRRLLSGANGIDRSTVLHSLLCTLAPKASKDDLLATVLTSPPLWQYCLDHRHDDPDRALKFAQEEVNRATKKQNTNALEELGKVLKPRQQQQNQEGEPAFELRERPLTLETLHRKLPPREFVVFPHLPNGKMVEFSGAHGISKSTMALDIVCRIATGQSWCGLDTKKGKAVFLSREDDYDDILDRVQRWVGAQDREKRGVLEKLLCENLRFLGASDTRGFVLTKKEMGKCTVEQDLVDYASEKYKGAALIVLETMSRLHGGDELNEDLAKFADALEEIANRTGACVMVIRHVSKSAAINKDTGSYIGRGGGSFADAARSVLTMVKLDQEDLRKKGVALDGLAAAVDSDILALEHSKANYTRPAETLYFMRLEGGILKEVKAPDASDEFGKRMIEYLARQAEGLTLRQLASADALAGHKVPKHRLGSVLESLLKLGKVQKTFERRRGNPCDVWSKVRRDLV